MKPGWAGLLGLVVAAFGTGCQCSPLYESYNDLIDDVADVDPELDPLYCPQLDLTRIGHPDWCQSPVNRALCARACCRRPPGVQWWYCPSCRLVHYEQ